MFHPGDKVSWFYTQRGGWNFQWHVPATVVKVTAKRIIIDAELAKGGVKRVTVKPENVRLKS